MKNNVDSTTVIWDKIESIMVVSNLVRPPMYVYLSNFHISKRCFDLLQIYQQKFGTWGMFTTFSPSDLPVCCTIHLSCILWPFVYVVWATKPLFVLSFSTASSSKLLFKLALKELTNSPRGVNDPKLAVFLWYQIFNFTYWLLCFPSLPIYSIELSESLTYSRGEYYKKIKLNRSIN